MRTPTNVSGSALSLWDSSVQQEFENQARRTPDATAIKYGDAQLTYRELDSRANELASHLRELGVSLGTRVAICLAPSADQVTAMLGVLKAGAAYVPLDPSHPPGRLQFMLDDSGSAFLVTRGREAGDLQAPVILRMDNEKREQRTAVPRQDLDVPLKGGENLAYVIYTSGSTGTPKGVCIPHRGILRLVLKTDYIHITSSDRIAQLSNASFDAATFEIWGALLNGATLVGVPREVSLEPRALAAYLRSERISVLFVTTALFNQVVAECPDAFQGLRQLLFGGEAVTPRWVRAALEAGAPERLVHVYGPTESTTFASWHLVWHVAEDATTIPIGRPLANTRLYVLDEALRPVPVGTAGELHIGGAGLALGYLGRPELTASRFIPDPWSGQPGALMYRTGDRVRLLAEGNLEFLGRLDAQVKLRGFRIEPGEVEAILRKHPRVTEAVVMLREDSPEDKRLVAYVVTSHRAPAGADSPASLSEVLRSWLREYLPNYMVPSAIVTLSVLPLTPGGKVDRQALPPPSGSRPELKSQCVMPRTDAERVMVSLWQQVLRVEPVGVDDNFFELGGDSLLAIRILFHVKEAFGWEPGIRALFDSPTVAGLAQHIEAARGRAEARREEAIAPARRQAASPLSFAQQRLWFLHHLEPSSAAYNVPALVRLIGRLDRVALERSLEAIVLRHEVLRTVFSAEEGTPMQVTTSPGQLTLPVEHLEGLSPPECHRRLSSLAREEFSRPFDLARGPLMRARLVVIGEEEHSLLLTLHHIVADGWSLEVLTRELAAHYEALCGGRHSPLPALPVQYADYAVWQRERLRGRLLQTQLEFWNQELKDAPHVLDLPGDWPRPPVQSFKGARHAFELPQELTRALRRLSREESVTLFMVLFAGFQVLLHLHTGREDLLVGTPIAGRDRQELEGLIGFFANTLVLRTQLQGELSFRELLTHVRERTLAAYAHAELPFERLVEELRPERSPAYQPLVQVMFALQRHIPARTTQHGLRVELTPVDSEAAPFDLLWQVWEETEALRGSVVYNADLFAPLTIARWVECFLEILAGIVANPDSQLSALASVGRGRAGEAEESARGLLMSGTVSDCVVRVRHVNGQQLKMAYVVPSTPGWKPPLLSASLAPDAWVRVSSIPLRADGLPDEDALRRLEVIEDALTRRWEEQLQRLPGVRQATVAVHALSARQPLLHLADLLPGWRVGPPVESGQRRTTAADAPGVRRPRTGAMSFSDGGPLVIDPATPATLVQALLRTAAANAGPRGRGITFVYGDGAREQLSYAELLEEAKGLLGGLRACGLRPGDRVILQLVTLREHFTTFWACVLGGITPATVSVAPSYDRPNAVVEKLFHAWTVLERPVILASAQLVEPLRGLSRFFRMEGLSVLGTDELGRHPPAAQVHESEPEGVVFIQLTSGSTSAPKCIQETHRGIIRHILGSAQHNGYGPDDVTLNWLPVDHVVPILTCHLRDVYLGCAEVQVVTDYVLSAPLRWLDLIQAFRVTHTWSPNFGFKLVSDALRAEPRRRWELSSIKFFMNAGEQVTAPVTREFLKCLTPFGVAPRAMQPAFGMAEACTCITYRNDFDVEASIHCVSQASLSGALEWVSGGEGGSSTTFVDLGLPIPGVQIRIADAEGRTLQEGVIGRLQIRGEVVTPGYLNNEKANRDAFVGDGWFNSGDLGFIMDGALVLTGREKEVIVLNGANYYCHEIEAVVEQVDGVEPTFAAACGVADPSLGTDVLAIFFVPQDGEVEAATRLGMAIRSRIIERLALTPAFVVPLTTHAFPKTTSGKIQRTQLKKAMEAGQFQHALKQQDLVLGNVNTVPDWFFQRVWRRRQPASLTAALPEGLWLIFLDRDGLGERLRSELLQASRRCVAVEAGSGFASQGEDRYVLDPLSPEHHHQLLARIGAVPAQVMHLGTYGAGAVESGGDLSVLHLVQALGRSNKTDRRVRLSVVSSGAQYTSPQEHVHYERAMLPAWVQTLPQELSWLDCRHIDLPPSLPEQAAQWVLREMRVLGLEREVVLRDGQRWVPRLERLRHEEPASPAPPFQQEGLYLITGGLGGVGVELATHLLRQYRARLLLIGRSPLVEGGTRARACAALRQVAVASGGEVVYEEVDVSNADMLHRAVRAAEARWGQRLDGVFHLAGIMKERLALDESGETLAATLRPKVQGARAVEAVLAERPASFFIGFSSVNGLLGGFSVGAYSAASRFLDAFAHERRRAGATRAWCLAWSLWDETGMSSGHAMKSLAHARGYLAISRGKGLSSLSVALRHTPGSVIIGLDGQNRTLLAHRVDGQLQTQQLSAFLVPEHGAAGALASVPEVMDRFGTPTTCRLQWVEQLPRTTTGEVDVRALVESRAGGPRSNPPLVAPRNERERILASIWREVLGVDPPGVHANFFELGGHSMLLARVRGRIETIFGRSVPVVDLFRHPTISALADFLGDPSSQALKPDGVEDRARKQRALHQQQEQLAALRKKSHDRQ